MTTRPLRLRQRPCAYGNHGYRAAIYCAHSEGDKILPGNVIRIKLCRIGPDKTNNSTRTRSSAETIRRSDKPEFAIVVCVTGCSVWVASDFSIEVYATEREVNARIHLRKVRRCRELDRTIEILEGDRESTPAGSEIYLKNIVSCYLVVEVSWYTGGNPDLIGYVCIHGRYGRRRAPMPSCTARNGRLTRARTSKSSVRSDALYASTATL